METLSWKIRIVVLWVIAAEAMSAHMIMVTIDPVAMMKMLEWGATINAATINTEWGATINAATIGTEWGATINAGWVFGAIYWLIPLWMAFVTITAKGSSNRWSNFVLGIIMTILGIYHFFMCAVPLSFIPPGPLAEPTAHHILLVGSSLVASALITWYAWKWPKQEAQVMI